MPPSRRRPAAAKTTADTSAFPGWDELVEEAHVDTQPYQLPLPAVKNAEKKIIQKAQTVEIPVFDGERYLQVIGSQRIGDSVGVMNGLFPNPETRQLVVNAMRGVPWPIVDVIATKVIRHHYGLDISPKRDVEPADDAGDADEELGNSAAE